MRTVLIPLSIQSEVLKRGCTIYEVESLADYSHCKDMIKTNIPLVFITLGEVKLSMNETPIITLFPADSGKKPIRSIFCRDIEVKAEQKPEYRLKNLQPVAILKRLMIARDKKTPLGKVLATMPAYFTHKYRKYGIVVTRDHCRKAWEKFLEMIVEMTPTEQKQVIGILAAIPGSQAALNGWETDKDAFLAANAGGSEFIRQRRFAPTKAGQKIRFELVPNYRQSRKSITKKTRKAGR